MATDTAVAERPRITARDDISPSGKQRAYIARLCLELLGVDYPESRKDAAELIDQLKRQAEATRAAGRTDECPF